MTEYEELRPLLFSIAYRMLGTAGDAEDIVQEALLRRERAERAGTEIESPRAYLTTVTTRLAIDHLRSARVKRESYVGSWLPEPLLSSDEPEPAEVAEMSDSLSLSFLVLLETLSPTERAVFLLREVFDYGYDEIGEIVEKTEANCRQINARARRRVDEGKPRFEADRAQREQLAGEFVEAFQNGEVDRMLGLLAPDVVFHGDGGGVSRSVPRPIYGQARVGRLLKAFSAEAAQIGVRMEPTTVNGQPGALGLDANGQLINVISFDIAGGRVRAIRSIVNPDKLRHLGYPLSEVALRARAASPRASQ
jgi:RNA polymerase sigma-70 factor (ECF subfamily)